MGEDNTGALEQELRAISDLFARMKGEVERFVVGHEQLVRLVFVALLAEGHILIEGAPGTAKTIIAKTIAQLSGCSFRRLQSAVDIQPADILGMQVFDPVVKEFRLKEGPVFSQFLLVDEINRLPPKTQGAFIEAMSERQVTLDGVTLPLPKPFFVMATQNPYEAQGTFPLIEAQRDRFLLSARIAHLTREEELRLVERAHRGVLDWSRYVEKMVPVTTPEALERAISEVKRVRMERPIMEYITSLVHATRTHGDLAVGASARASIAFVRASKAIAALDHRGFVIPDDVKGIAPYVLQHRLIFGREAQIRGVTPAQVMREIIDRVEVP